ncbi:unnamed protein product [Brachionus calyciflorus]|uniref:EF-hand domain-containing protein n=1 Tax=Brachionus calyciflorus TaxID=104777 RepID=A0A814AN95_9BILA|nr:unnamed protein product [Brachionus calyciflorus]
MNQNLLEYEKYLKKSSINTDHRDSEKRKFFEILKSIFAIFDPECNGSIDLNELDVLGADNNEILNDVLEFIRSNKILKPLNSNLNLHSRKLMVSFDEFLNAADIILDRRRTKLSRPAAQTLSQAFETPNSTTSTQNANSLDLNSLIEKENYLLRQGLDSLDSLKQWFTTQLVENKIKQTNLNKLKYQNLFSIDKLLIDLKQLNDLNIVLNDFLIKKNSDIKEENFASRDPPSYQEYLEQFGIQSIKRDIDLDKYLKEKQDRIDSLQKEKANLIRKMLEIKSESENINKNIIKISSRDLSTNKQNNLSNLNNREREIPIIIDRSDTNSLPSKSESYSVRYNLTKPKFI